VLNPPEIRADLAVWFGRNMGKQAPAVKSGRLGAPSEAAKWGVIGAGLPSVLHSITTYESVY
jgi:hypothetical protein